MSDVKAKKNSGAAVNKKSAEAIAYRREIGARIRELIILLGLSERSFGALVLCNQGSLNRHINGLRTPDSFTIKKIVEATGCDPKWLLSGSGTPGI